MDSADKKTCLSPLFWSLERLRAAYRERELSPVEVIEEALARISVINPKLNAYIGRLDELARSQALAAEKAWEKGTAKLLTGIPISIKDTFHIQDQLASYGSLVYQNNLVSRDSGVVRRLRDAGAVFIGRTNTSEFAQSATTENRFFDDAHNPWDPVKTAGGSSGGAAASVSAGLCSIAIGADGGGSIRIPASFTGLFGVKPTFGLCKDEGGLVAMEQFISPGPIARCVADARDICGVLADKRYIRGRIKKTLRLAFSARPSNCPHDSKLVEVFESAVAKLSNLGHQVVGQDIPLDGWQDAFGPLVLNTEWRERSHLLEKHSNQLTAYERRSLEAARKLTHSQIKSAFLAQKNYSVKIQKLFGKLDFLLMPTTAVTAFDVGHRPKMIDGESVRWLWGGFPCTAPFNVSGNPAVTIPCGFVNSMPVGMQIIGPKYSEEMLMNLSQDIEEILEIDLLDVAKRWSFDI